MKPLAAALLAAWSLSTGSAFADSDYQLKLSRSEQVSGTAVRFDGTVTYTIPADACAAIPVRLVVYLDDLNAKLLAIVKSTKVEKAEHCGNRIEIKGAHMSAAGASLAVKVEGKVGRQQCTKVFGTTVSTTLDTKASLEAVFTPRIEADQLKMDLTGGPRLNVSNDILRELLNAFDLDNKIERKLAEAVQGALTKPRAALQLPEQLAGFSFVFSEARADTVDGRLALVITGSSPRTQPLVSAFFSYLGAAPPAAPCP